MNLTVVNSITLLSSIAIIRAQSVRNSEPTHPKKKKNIFRSVTLKTTKFLQWKTKNRDVCPKNTPSHTTL